MLTGNTKIKLSQIVDLPLWINDRYHYKVGETAQWKDGLHKKTAHGWIKIAEEKDKWGAEIRREKKVTKLSDVDFYNSNKSFLFPPIETAAWKKVISKDKPVLLQRKIIQNNTTKHAEFKGQDKYILQTAISKGNVAKINRPDKKPNYCVIAKSGNYWYWVTIDTDPNKKYYEIVDWRKVNQNNIKEDMKK